MNKEEIIKRMHTQQLYYCEDENLIQEQLIQLDKIFEFNHIKPSNTKEKEALLKEMAAQFGIGNYIETPLYASWGCKNVYFGNYIYANFNLTLVDDCDIYIDDYVMIGPNVTLCTATHPIDPSLRKKKVQYNIPIHIEKNVWIGANSIVLPGVRIGENTIIGAGSIVNKDIPVNVVAVGSPCRITRKIVKDDSIYYHKDFKIDIR